MKQEKIKRIEESFGEVTEVLDEIHLDFRTHIKLRSRVEKLRQSIVEALTEKQVDSDNE